MMLPFQETQGLQAACGPLRLFCSNKGSWKTGFVYPLDYQ